MERKLWVGLFCRHVGGTNKDREFLRYLYMSFPFLRAHSNVVLRCARPFLNFVATINIDIIRFCSQRNLLFLNVENYEYVFSYDKLEIKLNGQVGLNMYNDG